MKQSGVILIVLLILSVYGLGQAPVIVTGAIRDTASMAISKATIHLVMKNDSVNTISRENGSFTLHLKQGEAFDLFVTMKGYLPFHQRYEIGPATSTLALPPITLLTNYEQLEAVTVAGIKPLIVKRDTIEYRTAAYAVRAGAELERLLRLLPGMITDTGGNIIIEGKQISRILINGRDYTGGNVLTALRNLPADIIEKIQVIDDYGDKARFTGVKSGESQKILNIILKKDKRNGAIGKFEAGAGNQDKYVSSAFTNKFKGDQQLNLNTKLTNNSPNGNLYDKLAYLGYSDRWSKKWSARGGISFWGDDHSRSGSSIQDNFFPTSQQHLAQEDKEEGNNRNLAITSSLEHNPDENSLLRTNSSFSTNTTREGNSSSTSTTEKDSNYTKTTNSYSLNHSAAKSSGGGSNIYFEKQYPKSKSRFSFQASYNYTNRQQDDDNLTNTNIISDSQKSYLQQHYLIHTNNFNKETSNHLNYYALLKNGSFIELAYSLNYSVTQNNRKTYSQDSSHLTSSLVDSLSNKYDFRTTNHRFHIGYLQHLDKLDLTVGLDASPASQNGKTDSKRDQQSYKYFNILPQAEISYSLSPGQKLHFEYNSSVLAPTLQQLQPVIDLTNPQFPMEGNPNLKPAYTQAVALHYELSSLKSDQFKGLGLGVSYNTTRDMILSNMTHPRDTNATIQKTTYINANGFNSLKGNYRINFPSFIHKHLRIGIDGDMSIDNAANMVDSIFFNSSSLVWSQGVSISFDIPDVTESQISGSYSHTLTRYSTKESPSTSLSSFTWVFTGRHTFLQKWIFNYTARQFFNSGSNGGLMANSVLMDASLNRDLFSKNQATLNFSVYNLFNQNAGLTQSNTPTSITQTRNNLTGRYFLLSIIFKLQKFK